MNLRQNLRLDFSVTIELKEDEARALNRLTQYSPIEVCRVLEGLSRDFREGGELHDGMRMLLAGLKTQLSPAIERANYVQGVITGDDRKKALDVRT